MGKGENTTEKLPLGVQFEELVKVTQILRGPDGCPWDRAQNHDTIKIKTIEEAYEVASVIEEGDDGRLVDELGDLLLQVLFHSNIAEERQAFSLTDVIGRLHQKLIRRHPHVFGTEKAVTAEQALSRWEWSKAQERRGKGSLMDGIAWSQPSLLLAHQVQKKASLVGFDWGTAEGALEKLAEEIGELKDSLLRGDDKERLTEEIGDLLFSAVNVARLIGINAEAALRDAVRKFVQRFQAMEREIVRSGRNLTEVDLNEMNAVWDRIKGEGGKEQDR